jgi:hypothetical protein
MDVDALIAELKDGSPDRIRTLAEAFIAQDASWRETLRIERDARLNETRLKERAKAKLTAADAENERLAHSLPVRDRQAVASRKFWVRAAKAALAGDVRELRNRVDLAEAEPLDVVLSEADQPPNFAACCAMSDIAACDCVNKNHIRVRYA